MYHSTRTATEDVTCRQQLQLLPLGAVEVLEQVVEQVEEQVVVVAEELEELDLVLEPPGRVE